MTPSLTEILLKIFTLTYLLTYSREQSPSWEADQFSQLTKKFLAFYGTRRFFTVLTSARHPSLSWANSIQSPRPPPTSPTSILILSYHLRLGLPNGLFPSGFPTNTLCTPLSSLIHTTCPAHLILLDLIHTQAIFWAASLHLVFDGSFTITAIQFTTLFLFLYLPQPHHEKTKDKTTIVYVD
jgi:hypothetical protein